jgi:DNA-binding CsgD family transcriptional regulator
MAPELVGRDPEIAAVELLLARIADGGGSLLVLGDPGIGKSALAEVASRRAAGRGMRVLACAGVPGEAQFSFAGLHQLLRPVLAEAGGLPRGQRDALLTALGVGEGVSAALPLVALAALELLAAGAGRAPVLVIAEDVHWLDSSTCEVLAFVSRRLGAEPVGLVGTARETELEDNPLAGAGLAELRLGPLDPVAAAALLDAHAVRDPVVRQRVLEEAAGNPLALVELPTAVSQDDSRGALPGWLPLTRRLEEAFASRLPGLPAVTRTALLAAGLNDGDALAEVLAAASVVAGAPVSVADLAVAVAAGLAEVDGPSVRFRHPLMRSAVAEAAGPARRQAMHRALAEVLAGVPDRQVWHRAAASVGPDEEVAAGLEAAADRAFGRGAIAEQAAALAAAARLSPSSAQRGQRLIRAAWAFYELGLIQQTTLRLLDEAEPLDLTSGDRLRLAWARETMGAATRSGARPLAALTGLADQMRQHGDIDEALLTLENVALRCFWSNPDRRTRQRMTAVAKAMPVAGDDPRLLFVLALCDPAEHGAAVLARLGRHQPGSGTAYQDYLLGYAAGAVGACEQAVGFLTAAAAGLRARGWLGLLGPVLLSQGWSALLLGQAGLAGPTAEEAARLLAERGSPLWAACAQLVQAVLAGRRGDTTTAAAIVSQAERVLLMGGVPPLLAQVQLARGTAALGAGRHDEAYEHLARIFAQQDPAYHPHVRAWALVDLAEAAAGGGYQDAARRHCTELIAEAAATRSPLLRASLTVAAPMLATGDAQALFDAAFDAGLAAWPLHRARLQLAYGMWLRRRQQAADSRAPLRAAKDTFDALGADAWTERARRELRAAGERSGQPAPRALDLLAPQELQIARLAAEGLSNREIGQQLYLSHRTVSNHLYRIFPKLGITSRAELAAVVGASPGPGVGH